MQKYIMNTQLVNASIKFRATYYTTNQTKLQYLPKDFVGKSQRIIHFGS